ncbi:hypothetical protein FWG86_00690 [Candidatus Saccharibacteria bacterium]|nr:hypothetical protein [Candidatus Saccharibacteria bacterium]
MKKQIIGTLLASAVILAAVGAAGFLNDRMEATDGEVTVHISEKATIVEITNPLDGAVITDPNYTVQVNTINAEELRFYNCYGAEIAICGQVNPANPNGVGYVSSATVATPGAWSTENFDASFSTSQEGAHRLMAIGYNNIGGTMTQAGVGDYVDVNFFNEHAPSLTVGIPGGSYAGGVWTLPKGNTFQVAVSYNDVNSLGLKINGQEVDTSSCVITVPGSGMVVCTVNKDSFPANEDGSVVITVSGKDGDGNVVVSTTIRARMPVETEPEVPDTGLGGGWFTFAREDMFLGGVVALLALGLMTVYILFRRSAKA